MLSKFSVKKPMTVLVAVVLVVVLGVVSFTSMTPNLLPNMDFPYMIVVTTYPGASPEMVETTVSKPLEQSLSVLDGVKGITSTSADNYSMVMIEYEDGTNMDSAVVDVSGKIDTLEGSWDEKVGTPVLMEINPDMLPAAVVAVGIEGMETTELSEYVDEKLLNRLEGIDGVASISTVGSVQEKINVVIDEKKLKEVNKKVQKAINGKFDEGREELEDGLAQLNDGLEQTKDGAKQIEEGKKQLEEQRNLANQQLSDAQAQMNEKQTEIANGKIQILTTISSLSTQRTSLQSTYEQIVGIQKILLEIKSSIQEMTASIVQLEAYQTTVDNLNAVISTFSPDTDEYKQALEQLKTIDSQLAKWGITSVNLSEKLEEMGNAMVVLQNSLEEIKQSLADQGLSEDTLETAITEMQNGIVQIDSALEQLNTTYDQLLAGEVTLNSAIAELNKQKSQAEFEMNKAYVDLSVGESTLTATQAQLEATKKELEATKETIDEQQETALDKANVENIITLDMVSGILTAQNFSMPAGYITEGKSQYLVRIGDKLADIEEMEELLLFDLGMDDVEPIYLKDVANVFISDNSNEVYAKLNGNGGIMFSFTKSSQTAVATVCENIIKEFESIKEDTENFSYTVMMSQGDYIDLVVNSVIQNLIVGAVFAIIVLLIFLKDIKPTLIVACSIPISVIFAIVLMYFSGVTLNLISLSGLAVGIGMLVDNSVVVIENIYRLRSLGMSATKAAMNGAIQVAGAITASTLTTICVFLPIVFIQGITKQIFVDLALTITYSLLASLLVALTLVPAMGKSMFKKNKEHSQKVMDVLLKGYDKAIRFALGHRALVLILAVVLLITSTALAMSKGFSFMPTASGAEMQISVSMPKGSELEDTIKVSDEILEIVSATNQYETVGAMIGDTTGVAGMGGGSNTTATVYMMLKSEYAKQSATIASDLQNQLSEKFDAEITVSSGSMGSMSMLMGSGVAVTVYCDNLDVLQKTANDLAKIVGDVDGIEKSDNGIADTTEEIRITVDKNKAMKHSLTVAQVLQQVAGVITTEKTATSLTSSDGSSLDVIVVDQKKENLKVNELLDQNLTYTTMDGEEKTITLGEIATAEKLQSMNSISRENQKRYLSVTGVIAGGYTTTDVSNRVKTAVEKYELPEGVTIEFTGENESTMESVFDMVKMLLLGIVFIYMIMVAQFQSLKSPFIVLFTIPLAFTGGFLGLFITGFDVSVVALIGFVMLCGVVVNNGIVLVDYVNQLRISGVEKKEALIEAGRTRMRPILMTAITTIIGLLSMALGVGEGTEMMQPVAIVCIGGLLYATIMTLFIVPVMYDLFNKKPMNVVSDEDLEIVND